jgi:hypothetical protein
MHLRWDSGAAATPHGQWVYFAEFLAGHRRSAHITALRGDAVTVLLEYAGELRAMQENWRKIGFQALREHAGPVFREQLDA